jgi:hypothetical protein
VLITLNEGLITHRNEEVRNRFLIARPSLTILSPASGDVPSGAVDDHYHEEDKVEPWEWTPSSKRLISTSHVSIRNLNVLEASNQTPSHGEEHIRYVVRLAHNSKPTIDHNLVASISLNEFGILDRLPRHLRECVALDDLIFLSEPDGVLLAVRAVPHPVEEQVHDRKCAKSVAVPAVLGWVVIGQVEGAVAVCERYAGEIPEREEEAKFFEVHIPGVLLVAGSSVVQETMTNGLTSW